MGRPSNSSSSSSVVKSPSLNSGSWDIVEMVLVLCRRGGFFAPSDEGDGEASALKEGLEEPQIFKKSNQKITLKPSRAGLNVLKSKFYGKTGRKNLVLLIFGCLFENLESNASKTIQCAKPYQFQAWRSPTCDFQRKMYWTTCETFCLYSRNQKKPEK